MTKVALTSGAYEARSVLANAQRSVNLYAEMNPKDSPFPFMLYPMPGLTQIASVSPEFGSGWRGLYWATNNKGYGVCGNTAYAIASDFTLTSLGSLATESGNVHMVDNGSSIIIVDGSSNGYTIDLSTNAFAHISQASFYGADYIDMLDGYFVLNRPGTTQWYISLQSSTSFDATDFANKNGFPDHIVGVGVTRRYLYLFGQETTEIWFNAGNAVFPFERLPGVFMQYGCMNANTIAQMDGDFYWLAQSEQGTRIVCKSQQFQAQKISTFAMDQEIQTYATVDDAFGYTFQMFGHYFYVLTFPTANKTWVYDFASSQWNEWLALDTDGNLLRHPSQCYATLYGVNIVGDYSSNVLYKLDRDNYTNNGFPISFIRGFSHSVDDDSNRLHYRQFILDMEVGNGTGPGNSVPVSLRWSDTRGKSWSNTITTSLGKEGEYYTSLQFQRLGMARDRVFEVSWSAPVKTAIGGAWAEVFPSNQ